MMYQKVELKDIQTRFTLPQLLEIYKALDLYAEICERMGDTQKFTEMQTLSWRFYDLWEAADWEGAEAIFLEPKISE